MGSVEIIVHSPEMKNYTQREINGFMFGETELLQLGDKIVKELLDADLTVPIVNAVLNYAWHKVLRTAKLRADSD